jgi:hypothetical protein
MSDKETIEKIVVEHSTRLIEAGMFHEAERVLLAGRMLAKYLAAPQPTPTNAGTAKTETRKRPVRQR